MKKYISSILILSILTSCTKQPKCDNDEALKLAKDLIKQELGSKENSMAFIMFNMGDGSTVDKFVDDNIELINVRTTEKNDELKKCDCASQISFKFSEEFKEKMKEIGDENFTASIINDILNKQFGYNYTLQILDKEDGLFIIAIVPIKDLNSVLTNYLMFAPQLEENQINTNGKEPLSDEALLGKEVNTVHQNETDVSVNSGEIINDKSYIYKERDYSSRTKMYLIKGDVFDIVENKNGFYGIHYKGINYDKNIEGYIPEDEIKLLYLDRYGNKTYIIE
jgi:hypothetical protein